MEIKIRNVDSIAVKKIDEMAKKNKLSRRDLLKSQLEMLTFFREQTNRELELENLIDKNILMVEKCALAMETVSEFIHEMIGEDEDVWPKND